MTAGLARNWLQRRLPQPRPVQGGNKIVRPKRLLILHKKDNPSLDYYLRARALASGIPCQFRCIDRDPLEDVEVEGLFVIICRYIHPTQLCWIARNRPDLAGVAYFIDDDVAALLCDRKIAISYRLYLGFFACLPLLWLNGLLSHLWVSTAGLANVLDSDDDGGGRAVVLDPAPVVSDHLPAHPHLRGETIRIVYHATHLHHGEHRFLVPVMEEVMRRRPQVRLEVVADGRSRLLWCRAAIPAGRLSLLAPMSWSDYQRHGCTHGADIALMPLLAGQANYSRAMTKLIDYARLGAAALMSDIAPYRHQNVQAVPRVHNSVRAWVDAILELVDRPDKRQKAIKATRDSVARMSFNPDQPFPGIICPQLVRVAR